MNKLEFSPKYKINDVIHFWFKFKGSTKHAYAKIKEIGVRFNGTDATVFYKTSMESLEPIPEASILRVVGRDEEK